MQYYYELKRNNITKDWASVKSTHQAGVIIKNPLNSKNELRIDEIATTTDTKQVNKEIINYLLTYLKDYNLLSKNAEPEKMYANLLTNKQRTNFLFSLIDLEKTDTEYFKFYSITDVEIKPDGTINLPEDIESLKDRVEHHFLEGHNLQEIKYIKDKEFRNYFIFINLTVEYNFVFDDITGRVQIQFGYPDFTDKTADKSEFEFKIQEIIPFGDKNLSKQEHHEINEFLKTEYNKLVTLKYEKTERKFKQLKLF